MIHETGVHFLDLFRWYFGETDTFYAPTRRLNPGIAGKDAGILYLSHRSGVEALFDGNRLSDHATDDTRRNMGEMWIEGAEGTLHLDGMGRIWHRSYGAHETVEISYPQPAAEAGFGGGCTAALIDHVISAAKAGIGFENTGEDYL